MPSARMEVCGDHRWSTEEEPGLAPAPRCFWLCDLHLRTRAQMQDWHEDRTGVRESVTRDLGYEPRVRVRFGWDLHNLRIVPMEEMLAGVCGQRDDNREDGAQLSRTEVSG